VKPLYIALIIVGVVVISIIAISPTQMGGSIGVVEIKGIISSSKKVVKDLERFDDNPSIKGILIRVDSPGGGVAASQEIYQAVKRVKKKVVVSMGAVAASGGYYVSLPADLIVANPGTMTGSIGVIMEFPIVNRLLDKLGIRFETIKSKEFKDIGSPFREMSESERRLLKEVVLDVYDQFVTAVIQNRGLDREKVLSLADGRIMSGRQAYQAGLIDTLGSFTEAVEILKEMVGIKEKPKLVYPPKRLNLLDLILGEFEERISIPKLQYLMRCGD